jgi:hypothetical protein
MLRHVASTDALQVSAKYTEINLRIYGPQVVTAAHTLTLHPTSKIAKENLEGKLKIVFLKKYCICERRHYLLCMRARLPNASRFFSRESCCDSAPPI